MRAADIHIGQPYAWAHTSGSRDYLKATVLDAPAGGVVRVRIEHPDEHVPDWEEEVKTRSLAGGWYSAPDYGSEYATQVLPDQEGVPHPARRSMPYAQYAAQRYAGVCFQRHRADRLRRLGINRAHVHYARWGGSEIEYGQNRLISRVSTTSFSEEEVDHLLDLAEAARGAA